jgi:hypothetical protein
MVQSGVGGYSEGSDGGVGGSQDDEPIRNPDGGKGGPGQGWPNPKRNTLCSLSAHPARNAYGRSALENTMFGRTAGSDHLLGSGRLGSDCRGPTQTGGHVSEPHSAANAYKRSPPTRTRRFSGSRPARLHSDTRHRPRRPEPTSGRPGLPSRPTEDLRRSSE